MALLDASSHTVYCAASCLLWIIMVTERSELWAEGVSTQEGKLRINSRQQVFGPIVMYSLFTISIIPLTMATDSHAPVLFSYAHCHLNSSRCTKSGQIVCRPAAKIDWRSRGIHSAKLTASGGKYSKRIVKPRRCSPSQLATFKHRPELPAQVIPQLTAA